MRKHRDLVAVIKSNGMRMTPARRHLLQFILDNAARQVSVAEIQRYLRARLGAVDRSSVYRNLAALQALDIVQEIKLPRVGRRYQYVFDRKVQPFFICKACGKSNRGNPALFAGIEAALKTVRGFSKANLSAVFYGYCARCRP